jgi:2'-5' RNA ligase
MRSFIAIDVESPPLRALLEELRAVGGGVRTVAPENLHITLRFLGEIEEGRAGDVGGAMEEVCRSLSPFPLSFQGVGVFPGLKRIRVVWVGVQEGKERLLALQGALEEALQGLGFPREKRFHPHLTLGRVKSPRDTEELRRFVEERRTAEYGVQRVERVLLKKSVLTPQGPLYSDLRICLLGGS